jgi:hypothetical protein
MLWNQCIEKGSAQLCAFVANCKCCLDVEIRSNVLLRAGESQYLDIQGFARGQRPGEARFTGRRHFGAPIAVIFNYKFTSVFTVPKAGRNTAKARRAVNANARRDGRAFFAL